MKATCDSHLVPLSPRHAAAKLLAAVALLLGTWFHAPALRADMVAARTTAAEIRMMNPLEAVEKEPVRLTGVVTALSGWKNSFFLQDGTAGISVNRADTVPALKPGDRVLVHGVTEAGAFAPSVGGATVQIVGHSPLPAKHLFRMADLEWGAQDSQWVAVQGEIRFVERRQIWGRPVLMLSLSIGAVDTIPVFLHDSDLAEHAELIGATVTVQGVCGTVFNDKRQYVGLRLFTNSLKDVHVDRAAPADPYDFPFRGIEGLLQFTQATATRGQVKIQGTVTWAKKDIGFYLQHSSRGAFIADRTAQVEVGTEVVAVGYPSLNHASPMLHATHWRSVGLAPLLAPLERDARDMITIENGFPAAPYDSVLVKITGKVLEYVPGAHEDTLILESGPVVFRAKLPKVKEHEKWEAGSVLSLSGVCVTSTDGTHEDKSFDLQLRSADDIVQLHAASWWTARHALWLSAALSVVLLIMLGWVTFLRRQASLRMLADTDALTGLHNRRGFLLFAQKQVELSRRQNSSFLLFYIDFDHFKQINDLYGHRAGDAALKEVSGILRRVFRECDILGRLGGDEFAVMAIDAGSEAGKMLRERIDSALLEQNRHHKAQVPYKLSLSIGVLHCDQGSTVQPIEDLLEQADGLMYKNKRGRRLQEMTVPVMAQ